MCIRDRRIASRLAPHLGVSSPEHVRDVLTAMVLCECVYKTPESEVRSKVAEFQAELPPGVVDVRGLQVSLDHVKHRYLVAESPGAVYVACMGTKEARDLLADAAYLQTPLVLAALAADGGGRRGGGEAWDGGGSSSAGNNKFGTAQFTVGSGDGSGGGSGSGSGSGGGRDNAS